MRSNPAATLIAGLVMLALVALLPSTALATSVRPTADAAVPPAIPSDTTLFTDDFEAGLGAWTVTRAVNGSVGIESRTGRTGALTNMARITVPDYANNSIAYLKRTLDAPVYALSASGYFNVLAGGCDGSAGYSSGSVPFLRFFDTNNRRVVGLYRINGSCSKTAKIYVQHSGSFFRTGKNMGFNSWVKWELRMTVNGGSSRVWVYMNDTLVYEAAANNGIVPIASVNIHNEHPNQVGDLLADEIRLATFDTTAPVNPCATGTPLPSNGDPGTTVVADNFESFNLNKWSATGVSGDGFATVSGSIAHTGSCAAVLHATANSSSRAYLSKVLPTGAADVYLDGWMNVTVEGASGSNVPFWRIFAGSNRLVDVYRTNVAGALYLRTPNGTGGWTYTSLGRTVALNTWHRVQVHAVAATGTVEVRYDGTLVKTLTGVPFGASSFSSAQVHAEHFAQQGDIAADDVVIKVAAN